MAEIIKTLTAVNLDSIFKKAISLKEAQLDVVANKCLEAFSVYGLKPSQLAMRPGDLLFTYDLSFRLFNNNFTFQFTGEKLHLEFQNAGSQSDLEILGDCLAKVQEQVTMPEVGITGIAASAQAFLQSPEEVNAYLSKYSFP